MLRYKAAAECEDNFTIKESQTQPFIPQFHWGLNRTLEVPIQTLIFGRAQFSLHLRSWEALTFPYLCCLLLLASYASPLISLYLSVHIFKYKIINEEQTLLTFLPVYLNIEKLHMLPLWAPSSAFSVPR